MVGIARWLETTNFKTHRGVSRIDLGCGLWCFVGRNGSGKSNVLDAVLFVVGCPARFLRVSRLVDVISTGEEESKVAMGIQDREDFIVFSRSVRHSDGRISHSINGQTCSATEYRTVLSLRTGLDAERTGRFILPQGAVMGLIGAPPDSARRLLSVVEEALPTSGLAAQAEELKEREAKVEIERKVLADETLPEALGLLQALRPLREEARGLTAQAAEQERRAVECRMRLRSLCKAAGTARGTRLAKIASDLVGLEETRQSLSQRVQGARSALGDASKKAAEAASKAVTAEGKVAKAERRLRLIEARVRMRMKEEKTEPTTRLDEVPTLEARLDALEMDILDTEHRLASARAQAVSLRDAEAQSSGALASIAAERRFVQATLRRLETTATSLKDVVQKSVRAVQSTRDDKEHQTVTLRSFERLRSAADRALVTAAARLATGDSQVGTEWRGVLGRVGDLLEVAGPFRVAAYAVALHTGVASDVFVEAFDDAEVVVGSFREQRAGVVSCIVLNGIVGGGQKSYRSGVHRVGGSGKSLAEHITPSKGFKDMRQDLIPCVLAAVERLFGRWVIVGSDSEGLALTRTDAGARCVGLDGMIFSGDGEFARRHIDEGLIPFALPYEAPRCLSPSSHKPAECIPTDAQLEERRKERAKLLSETMANASSCKERLVELDRLLIQSQAERDKLLSTDTRSVREDVGRLGRELEHLRTQETTTRAALMAAKRRVITKETGRRTIKLLSTTQEQEIREEVVGLGEDDTALAAAKTNATDKLSAAKEKAQSLLRTRTQAEKELEPLVATLRETSKELARTVHDIANLAKEQRDLMTLDTNTHYDIVVEEEGWEEGEEQSESDGEEMGCAGKRASLVLDGFLRSREELERDIETCSASFALLSAQLNSERLKGIEEKTKTQRQTVKSLKEAVTSLQSRQRAIHEELESVERRRYEGLCDGVALLNSTFSHSLTTLFPDMRGELVPPVGPKDIESGVEVLVRGDGAWDNAERLSGGERAGVALAVLLALSSLGRCALLMFDELDAALDDVVAKNAAKLIKTISIDRVVVGVTLRIHLVEVASGIYGVIGDGTRSAVVRNISISESETGNNKK